MLMYTEKDILRFLLEEVEEYIKLTNAYILSNVENIEIKRSYCMGRLFAYNHIARFDVYAYKILDDTLYAEEMTFKIKK